MLWGKSLMENHYQIKIFATSPSSCLALPLHRLPETLPLVSACLAPSSCGSSFTAQEPAMKALKPSESLLLPGVTPRTVHGALEETSAVVQEPPQQPSQRRELRANPSFCLGWKNSIESEEEGGGEGEKQEQGDCFLHQSTATSVFATTREDQEEDRGHSAHPSRGSNDNAADDVLVRKLRRTIGTLNLTPKTLLTLVAKMLLEYGDEGAFEVFGSVVRAHYASLKKPALP